MFRYLLLRLDPHRDELVFWSALVCAYVVFFAGVFKTIAMVTA